MSVIESLESRKYCVVDESSVFNSDGSLTLTISNAQHVEVREISRSEIFVVDHSVPDGRNNHSVFAGPLAPKGFSSVIIQGTIGSDKILVSVAEINALVHGNNGSDTFDLFTAGTAEIKVTGGNSGDTFFADGSASATGWIRIDGGNGSDFITALYKYTEIIPSTGNDTVI